MKVTLEIILKEKDKGISDGDLALKYSSWLKRFSKSEIFLDIISENISKSTKLKNFNRFNFIVFILQGFGTDSQNQKTVYLKMMEFINDNIQINEGPSQELDLVFELVLDVFWHQDKGLNGLDKEGQESLFHTLKKAINYKYERSVNGDEPFFAINKSMDLIKYQDEYGNTDELKESYLNHFDEHVRLRATETIKRL
ncbi:MAG: hypothetical protein R2792_14710 [Saprospiraceae bacterium]